MTTVFRDDGSAVLSRVDGKHGQLGDEEVFVCDMRSTPDLVPAVAVALCFSSVKFELRGVGHLRYKECDRLEALAEALASFGYVLEIGNDELIWNGLKSRSVPPGCVEINTRSDHRMLMAFAPLVFRGYSIRFDDLECVAKSFPGFATQFARLREDFGKCNAL